MLKIFLLLVVAVFSVMAADGAENPIFHLSEPALKVSAYENTTVNETIASSVFSRAYPDGKALIGIGDYRPLTQAEAERLLLASRNDSQFRTLLRQAYPQALIGASPAANCTVVLARQSNFLGYWEFHIYRNEPIRGNESNSFSSLVEPRGIRLGDKTVQEVVF